MESGVEEFLFHQKNPPRFSETWGARLLEVGLRVLTEKRPPSSDYLCFLSFASEISFLKV